MALYFIAVSEMALYFIAVSEMADEFFLVFDSKISADTVLFLARKLSRLIPYPYHKARRFYGLENSTTLPVLGLPFATSTLTRWLQLTSVSRTDVTMTSYEMDEYSAATKFLAKMYS